MAEQLRLVRPDDSCEDRKCERKRGHSGRHRGHILGMRATWETWHIFDDIPEPAPRSGEATNADTALSPPSSPEDA